MECLQRAFRHAVQIIIIIIIFNNKNNRIPAIRYVRAYVCRAEAYHYLGELKAALRDMTKAIHMQPATQHLYAQRGQLLMEIGDLELAGFCVRHAAQVNQNIG